MERQSVLFVDDDTNLIDGLRRALRSKRNEWDILYENKGKEAVRLVTRVGNMPTAPTCYAKLTRALESKDASIDTAGKIIENDPGMSGIGSQIIYFADKFDSFQNQHDVTFADVFGPEYLKDSKLEAHLGSWVQSVENLSYDDNA